MASENDETIISRELTSSIQTAPIARLAKVLRVVRQKFPTLSGLIGEMKAATRDGLRATVLGICEDVDGRKIVGKQVNDATRKENGKRKLDGTELFPIFNDAKKRAVDEQLQTTKHMGEAERINRSTKAHASTKASRPVLRYKPPAQQKKSVEDIFAADAQRRVQEERDQKEALKDDKRLVEEWRVAEKRCGRCRQAYVESRNFDDMCVWHDCEFLNVSLADGIWLMFLLAAVLRTISKEGTSQQWHCCGASPNYFDRTGCRQGCMQSEHVDGSKPGVMAALEAKRMRAQQDVVRAGHWESDRWERDEVFDDPFDPYTSFDFQSDENGSDIDTSEPTPLCSVCCNNEVPDYEPNWDVHVLFPHAMDLPICNECALSDDSDSDDVDEESDSQPDGDRDFFRGCTR